MRSRINERQCRKPAQHLLVLRDSKRKERPAQRIPLTLERAEFVVADIGILRRVCDVATLGQPRGKRIVRAFPFRNYVRRAALETMLTHHHRPPLARGNVLGDEQNAVVEHVGQHVQRHFVAGPGLAIAVGTAVRD